MRILVIYSLLLISQIAFGQNVFKMGEDNDTIYYDPSNPPQVFKGGVVYAENYSTEALALFARMPVSLSTIDKQKIDTLVTSLVDSGYWNRIDDLWVMSVKDSANACIDWKRASNNLIPKKNITFDTYKGFVGHAADSSHIETNFIPKTDGVHYKKNSASLITYQNSNVREDHCGLIGASNAPGDYSNTFQFVRTANIQSKVNTGAGTGQDIDTYIYGKHDGFLVTSRYDTTHTSVFFNGYPQTSVTTSTTGAALGDSAFHLLNNGYTNGNNSDNRIGIAAVADSFNASEQLALYNMFYKYLKSVGGTYDSWSNDTVLKQGFEGTGYDNSGYFTEAGTVNEDSTNTVLSGAQSCYLAGATGQIQTYTALNGGTTNCNFMFRTPDATPEAVSNIYYGSARGGAKMILVRLNTNGKLIIYNNNSSANGTLTLQDNTTYYLWCEYIKGTGANGVTKVYIATTNSKPALPDCSITNGDATVDINYFIWYGTSTSALYDDIVITKN